MQGLQGEQVAVRGQQVRGKSHGLTKAHLPVVYPAVAEAHPAAAISMDLAHQQLAHAAPSTIARVIRQGGATGLKVTDLSEHINCEACQMGKAQQLPFPKVASTKAKAPLHVVSMDLWGPARVPTLGRRALYVLSLICHYTSMVWALLLPNKESATVQAFLQKWAVKVERQSDCRIKFLRSDNGTEFKGAVEEWVEAKGMERQLTAPYSPQQNGRVERWHKTLGEGVRTLLLSSGLPANLWGEAVQ